MSSSLLSISLSLGICVFITQNFEKYEKNYPIVLYQVAYTFLIYYNFFARVKDQNMSKFKFVFICFLKRFNKFVFFSLLYFQTPIRSIEALITNFYYMIGVGLVFMLVPFKTWEQLVNRVFPFRFVLQFADRVFISSDMIFIWSQTIESPWKVTLFRQPEHEYLFFVFFMGSMSFLQDCVIQTIRNDKFLPISSVVQSVLNYSVGGILGYLGFFYYSQIKLFLESYGVNIKHNDFELMKIIFFIYYCMIAGYYAQLPKLAESDKEKAKIEQQKVVQSKKLD